MQLVLGLRTTVFAHRCHACQPEEQDQVVFCTLTMVYIGMAVEHEEH